MSEGPITQISTLTCPVCGFPATEAMPLTESVHYYQCMECGSMITPEEGSCCVFCSYGSAPCPPAQAKIRG